MDDTYAAVVSELPGSLQPVARRLLEELGMARGQACRWDEVFQLEPCRELPRFALGEALIKGEQRLEPFLRAHHCACFHGVLVDRLADRQAEPSAGLEELACHLLTHWRRSLAEATGDAGMADQSISKALRAWRLGVRLEQEGLAQRRLSPQRYARLVLLKLSWAGLASDCLLLRITDTRRLQLFRHAYLMLMLGMQCMDDAVDAPEDAALHGTDIPAVLGMTRASLFRTGVWLTRAAVEPAREGGFERFAAWLSARAEEVARLHLEGSSVAQDFEGYILASLLEETCRPKSLPVPAGSAATTCSGRSMMNPVPGTWSSWTTPSSVH